MIVGWAEADSSSPIQQEYPIPQNSVNHDIVAIWDIYPTILNMLKLKVPVGHQVDGEDISPYFRGILPSTAPRRYSSISRTTIPTPISIPPAGKETGRSFTITWTSTPIRICIPAMATGPRAASRGGFSI